MDWFAMSSKFYIDLDDAGVSEAAQTFLTRALGFMADNETGGFLSVADSKKLGLSRIPGRISQLENQGIMVRVCAVSEDHPCAIAVSSLSHPCSISVSSASSSVSYPCSHRGWNFPAWMKWQAPLERQVRKKKADRDRAARKRSEAEKVARHSNDETRKVAGHSNSNQEQELSTYVESASHVSNADASERPGKPVDVDGWRLVREQIPAEHPQASKTALAMHAGALLKGGTPVDDIRSALALWLTKPNLGPGTLPSLVSEVIRNRDRPAATSGPKLSTADQRVADAQALKSRLASAHDPFSTKELT